MLIILWCFNVAHSPLVNIFPILCFYLVVWKSLHSKVIQKRPEQHISLPPFQTVCPRGAKEHCSWETQAVPPSHLSQIPIPLAWNMSKWPAKATCFFKEQQANWVQSYAYLLGRKSQCNQLNLLSCEYMIMPPRLQSNACTDTGLK